MPRKRYSTLIGIGLIFFSNLQMCGNSKMTILLVSGAFRKWIAVSYVFYACVFFYTKKLWILKKNSGKNGSFYAKKQFLPPKE